MLYGNPEVIVHNLIAKVRTTPPPKSDRLDTLIEFSVAVQNLCATIEACQLDEYSHNVMLLREFVDKLPPSIKVDWAKYRRNLPCVSLTTFSMWLYDLAETVCPIAMLPSIESRATRGKKDAAYLSAHTDDVEDPRNMSNQLVSCPSVDKCKRFAELSYNSRWATVKEFSLCRKCLKKHKGSCRSQQSTRQHYVESDIHEAEAEDVQQSAQAERECNMHLKSTNKTLFRVVPVILYGPEKSIRTHAFLDDGSSLTLIDAALATELRLSGKPEPLCLRWTSNKSLLENDSLRLNVEISGTGENHKKYSLQEIGSVQEVHTVSNLDLFQQSVNAKELVDQYPYRRGIPVESFHGAQPRILIGIDNANLTLPLKGREGGLHQPIATKTRLGWIIHGGTEPSQELIGFHSLQKCPCGGTDDAALQNMMTEYFSIENLGVYKPKNSLASIENQRAEDILNKPMALRRLCCLESRLKKDPELAAVLRTKISEYLAKGYIRKLTKEELSETRNRVWYLPIFPVFNQNKPGKVRIVWDAAAKASGVSLNSMLLTGPDQLTSLMSVLIKFREKKVAFCGDLREMFHQVRISTEDQNRQRFLWRETPTEAEPSTYIMQVMTFGACCSPSCAQYVKNLNAEKHAGQYPAASKAIVKNHYVDDMLVSTETECEAIQLARDVHYVHIQAGFEMCNWLSNSPAVLAALQKEQIDEKSLNIGSKLATEKVLGMWWCTATDTLTFKLSAKHDSDLLLGRRRPTKREVLRTLMAIFDPLGLLSHLLIFLRVLLQEIWRSAIGWDDEIPDNINEK
ncbi:uncharacterized protein LOC129773333 [Toxorhynchites rutilus septentrionalis]|uniref:uncharacterized protein LOC129773333 n=1 Tax=Toxorhynchites rutilus septentrionalis TaxID=329112 RepID=UPI002479A1C9|nr:uncharacterized protein LOC129773333 [Toxorhynchites rutilus septentrionalis]